MKSIYSLAIIALIAASNMPALAQTLTDSITEQPDAIATELPYQQPEEAEATSAAYVDDTALLSPQELTAKADSAYSADNFELAADLYNKAASHFGTSATLFYNLGNTYYRMGYPGRAILNYERALKLDPTNTDARTNLEFLHTKIADKQIDDSSFVGAVATKVVSSLTADAWAWVALGLFTCFIAGLMAYFFMSQVTLRKIGFFGGGIALVLSIVCIFTAISASNRRSATDRAIILSPSAQLSTSPRSARNNSEQAFLLHEGTRVEVLDSVAAEGTMWYEVTPGNGERAWIRASDLERI